MLNHFTSLKKSSFTNLTEMENVTQVKIIALLKDNKKTSKKFVEYIQQSNVNLENSALDDYHRMIIGLYVEHKLA